jgi:hypothetical protein
MIASMMSGANKVSLRIDPTYPRSIFSADPISLIADVAADDRRHDLLVRG